MLTELTSEQKAQLKPWADKWIKIGLSTEQADWNTFEINIRKCYEFANLDQPKEIIRISSPLRIVDYKDKFDTAASVYSAVYSAVNSAVHSAVGSVIYSVYSAVDSIYSAVGSIVDSAVGSIVYSPAYFGGQFWSGWLAFISFSRDICKLELPGNLWERFTAYENTIKSAGPYWTFKDTVIVSDRPKHIDLDDRERLHSLNRQSIEWRNGDGIYAYHGVVVPKKVITNPDSYTAKEIKEINNTEIIRSLAEILGWDKYLDKLGIKTIDKWTDPKTGLKYELLESQHRFEELEPRYIRKQSSVLKDGNQPWYIEPIHPGVVTAMAARKLQAMSSFLDDENELEKLVEYCNNNPELNYDWEK